MRAGDDVGDDFRVVRVRDAWLEDAHDGSAVRVNERIKPDTFAEDVGIAMERCRPEAIREYDSAVGLGTVIALIQESPKYRPQAHNPKVRSIDNACAHRAGFSEPDHGEANFGEIAEGTEGFQPRGHVRDFGN